MPLMNDSHIIFSIWIENWVILWITLSMGRFMTFEVPAFVHECKLSFYKGVHCIIANPCETHNVVFDMKDDCVQRNNQWQSPDIQSMMTCNVYNNIFNLLHFFSFRTHVKYRFTEFITVFTSFIIYFWTIFFIPFCLHMLRKYVTHFRSAIHFFFYDYRCVIVTLVIFHHIRICGFVWWFELSKFISNILVQVQGKWNAIFMFNSNYHTLFKQKKNVLTRRKTPHNYR